MIINPETEKPASKDQLLKIVSLLQEKVIILREVFKLSSVDFPNVTLLALLGNHLQMHDAIVNYHHGYAYVFLATREYLTQTIISLNNLILSLNNPNLLSMINNGLEGDFENLFQEREINDDEILEFLSSILNIGIMRIQKKPSSLNNNLSDNLAKIVFIDSNGFPVSKDFRNVWTNINYQTRVVYLWEVILSMIKTDIQPENPINVLPYDRYREALRMMLSSRAKEIIAQGQLDVVLPPNFPKDSLGNLKIGEQNHQELIAIANSCVPDEEWVKKVNQVFREKEMEINQKITEIQKKYPSLPMPSQVMIVPVKYGTVGSFDSGPTSSIARLNHGLKFDPRSGQIISDFDKFLNWTKTDPNQRNNYGTLLPYVYSAQNTDDRTYPFLIYVRFPENIEDIDVFVQKKLLALSVEEYLHLSLFHWSIFYGWPHEIEEFVVQQLLCLNNLSHSGTPSNLTSENQIILTDAVLKFHSQKITFNDLATAINKIVYPNYETKTEINDRILREKNFLVPITTIQKPKLFDIQQNTEELENKARLLINILKDRAIGIAFRYGIVPKISNLDIILLASLIDFFGPKPKCFSSENTPIMKSFSYIPTVMNLHRFMCCLGSQKLEEIYFRKDPENTSGAEIYEFLSELDLEAALTSISEICTNQGLPIGDYFISKMRHHYKRFSGTKLWEILNKEFRASIFLSACIQNINLKKQSPNLILTTYEGKILERKRTELNHRTAILVSGGNLDFKIPDGTQHDYHSTAKAIEIKLFKKISEIQARIDGLSSLLPPSFPLATTNIAIRIAFTGTTASFTAPLSSLLRGLTFNPVFNQEEGILESTPSGFEEFLKTDINNRDFFGQIFPFYLENSFFAHQPLSVIIRFPDDESMIDDFINSKLIEYIFEEILHISIYHFSTYYGWPHAVEEFIVLKLLKNLNLSHSQTPIQLDAGIREAIEPEINKFLSKDLSFVELTQIITQVVHTGKKS